MQPSGFFNQQKLLKTFPIDLCNHKVAARKTFELRAKVARKCRDLERGACRQGTGEEIPVVYLDLGG